MHGGGFYGAGRKLLQTRVMSSYTVVCEHVCYELRRPAMSAVLLRSEEDLHPAHGSSSLCCLAMCAGEIWFVWFVLIECT